jgi:hypothetical protein
MDYFKCNLLLKVANFLPRLPKNVNSKRLVACQPVANQLRYCHSYKIGNPGGIADMADLGPKAMIDERRASVLLGLTPPELRWFSRMLGLGNKQQDGDALRIVFTYDELKRLSSAAAASAK